MLLKNRAIERMDYVDYKFINLLSPQLQKYHITSSSPFRANFRCPVCGDSQKNKNKTRGWILSNAERVSFYCHNCNASMSLSKFMKYLDAQLWNEWKTEKVMSKFEHKLTTTASYPFPLPRILPLPGKWQEKLLPLSESTEALSYVKNRKIPETKWSKIFFVENFNEFINGIIPNKLENDKGEPRIVFPFISKDGVVFGFTGRALAKDSFRYITIMIDGSYDKIFGMNKINMTKRFYITEGPIDSLFLVNAIAMAGSSLSCKSLDLEHAVFIYDNEPRNKEIVKLMHKVVRRGNKIFIWPSTVKDQKDINDAVLAGINIQTIIEDNIYQGLMAEQKINEWRK